TVMGAAPHLKMVIDTRKPIVRSFQAQRHGDDVLVTWDVQEDNPDPKEGSIRLEYQVKEALVESWKPVTRQVSLRGQTTFNPQDKRAHLRRLTVGGLAGNESYGQAEVAGTVVTAGFNAAADDKKAPQITPGLHETPLPKFPDTALPKAPPDMGKL